MAVSRRLSMTNLLYATGQSSLSDPKRSFARFSRCHSAVPSSLALPFHLDPNSAMNS
jgi:hypothetical protein